MNKLKLTSFVCGGMISLAGSTLMAQQPSTSTTTDPSSSSSTSRSSSTLPGSSSSSSTLDSTQADHWHHAGGQSVRLSNLMNSPVQSHEGKTLGYIRDFTVDPQSGHVQFAILSLSAAGGAADTSTSGRETVPSSRSSVVGTPSTASGSTLTGKLVPVPWQLFSQSWNKNNNLSSSQTSPGLATGGHNLVLNIDESKLQSAPSFDANNWTDMQQSTFDQRIYSYYGVDRMSGAGTSGSSISGQGTGSINSNGSSSRGAKDSSAQDYGTGRATGGTGAKGGATDLQK
jgi:sporulation protein YlmC with PRC-barrel domain